MGVDEDRNPATEKGIVAPPTELSLRLQVTDPLLGRLREASMGWSSREHSEVLRQIEAALETYVSYFYPPEHR
jgi:hypothetical protein